MNRRLWFPLVVLLVLVGMGSAMAAVQIGYVDLGKLKDSYTKYGKAQEELDAYHQQLETKLQVFQESLLLTSDEANELAELRVKANASDKEKARTKELQDKQVLLDKELTDLAAKKEPTAQEQARLKELQGRLETSKSSYDKTSADYEKQFNTKLDAANTQLQDDVNKAIGEVAKDKNLDLVVNAVSRLYGGVDITSDVLARLQKNK